jgi:hypothetical protein
VPIAVLVGHANVVPRHYAPAARNGAGATGVQARLAAYLIPLLQWEEGLGEEGPRGIGATGNLLSLTLPLEEREKDLAERGA